MRLSGQERRRVVERYAGAVRLGVSATEAGNTYEQFVRAWRLADFVVAHVLGEKEPVSWISFQHRDTCPWDDIVEQLLGERGLRAWQVKSLTRPLSDAAVSELLVALGEHPDVEEGVLAVSHALASPAGLDLMVVEGLCDAARSAGGRLERFRIRDSNEERCLDRLVALMKVERREVFAVLRRFRVEVLHGKPDVIQMTERALRPVFERPEELAQALLGFVATHGAPGVEIHFDVLDREVLTRFSRRTTAWVPPPPAESPDDEVLLWMSDRRGVARTLWLCDREKGSVVADIPELLLGTHDKLLRWERYPVLVPVLQNNPFPDDDEEDEEDRIVLETKDSAQLKDLGTEATLPLITLVVASDAGFYSVDQEVEILGSFDHVLLARVKLDVWAGGAHGLTQTDFVVIDLREGQRFSLWTEEEARQYVNAHRAKAIVQFYRDFERLEDGTEPKLSLCDPYYGKSYELRTRLQLSFDVCGALRDGTWGGGDEEDYYASTVVESDLVPATLAHARKAPAVLRRYWDAHPMDGRCGWTRVPKIQAARELLEKIAKPYATKLGATR